MEIITTRKLTDSLYQINEIISENAIVHMYLVVGDEKAALVDSGYGLSGDLDQVVRRITDKPVICLLTHSDPDHAGSAALFDEIYMNEKEKPLLDAGSIAPLARFATIKAMCDDQKKKDYIKNHMVKANTFSFRPVEDGQIFQLGNLELEAIHLPGHTEGSMCFWNRKENYCLVGDSVANVHSPVLFFKKCTSLEEYRNNFLSFIDKVGMDCALYSGHNEEKIEMQVLKEIPILCEDILNGQNQFDTPYVPPFLEEAPADAPLKDKLVSKISGKIVGKMNLGDAIPMEHTRPGFLASIKYNENKIHMSDVKNC